MDKKDMAKVLAILQTNYQKKIENTEATVGVWMMSLGEFSTEAVLNSAKLHMASSKFFPTPAEIRENIVRHKIVLEAKTVPRLESGQRAKVTAIPDGMSEEDFLDSIIADQIALETEMENNSFLNFER